MKIGFLEIRFFKNAPKQTFTTPGGFVLTVGKKYLWSGCIDKVMNIVQWKDLPCKITGVDLLGRVVIYDYQDKQEHVWRSEGLRESHISFKEKRLFG